MRRALILVLLAAPAFGAIPRIPGLGRLFAQTEAAVA